LNWITERLRGMFDLQMQLQHARESMPAGCLVITCAALGIAAYEITESSPYYFVCHFLFAFTLPFVFAAIAPRSPVPFLLGCAFSGLFHFGHELYYDPMSKAHGLIDIDHLIAGGIGLLSALPVYFIWLYPPRSYRKTNPHFSSGQ